MRCYIVTSIWIQRYDVSVCSTSERGDDVVSVSSGRNMECPSPAPIINHQPLERKWKCIANCVGKDEQKTVWFLMIRSPMQAQVLIDSPLAILAYGDWGTCCLV